MKVLDVLECIIMILKLILKKKEFLNTISFYTTNLIIAFLYDYYN